jgi:hypothetical protein
MPRFSLKWLFAIPAVVGLCYAGSIGAMAWLLLISFFLLLRPRPFSIGFALAMWLYTAVAWYQILSVIRPSGPPTTAAEKLAAEAQGRQVARAVGIHTVGMLAAGLVGGGFLHLACRNEDRESQSSP